MRAYQDFREFLAVLEQEKQLLRITAPVQLEPDLAAAACAATKLGNRGPAIYFDNIAGYSSARIVMNVHGSWANHALALGMDKDAPLRDQFFEFVRRYRMYPGELERVNSALSKDVGEGRFVTFVAAICSPTSSQVELLSAGHGPLFVYWLREDRFDEMSAQGLPLGLMPDLASEPPKILDFQSGDLLVLTTDGFFEWANGQKEQFGIERLEHVVRASRHLSPKEIISTVYRAVVDFSGGTKQQDDLTAVIIKRT